MLFTRWSVFLSGCTIGANSLYILRACFFVRESRNKGIAFGSLHSRERRRFGIDGCIMLDEWCRGLTRCSIGWDSLPVRARSISYKKVSRLSKGFLYLKCIDCDDCWLG